MPGKAAMDFTRPKHNKLMAESKRLMGQMDEEIAKNKKLLDKYPVSADQRKTVRPDPPKAEPRARGTAPEHQQMKRINDKPANRTNPYNNNSGSNLSKAKSVSKVAKAGGVVRALAGRAGAVGAAGAVGYALGTAVYDSIQDYIYKVKTGGNQYSKPAPQKTPRRK